MMFIDSVVACQQWLLLLNARSFVHMFNLALSEIRLQNFGVYKISVAYLVKVSSLTKCIAEHILIKIACTHHI